MNKAFLLNWTFSLLLMFQEKIAENEEEGTNKHNCYKKEWTRVGWINQLRHFKNLIKMQFD